MTDAIKVKECQADDFNKIVMFLVECRKNNWELDTDDIGHVLALDFDYVRKQEELIPKEETEEILKNA